MIYLRYWLVYGEARKHQPSSLKPSPVLFPLCYFLPGVICSHIYFASITLFQFSSVAQSCPALCDPMNHSTPGLPVHHLFPEFTQTHVHWVSDAIHPSHPLSSPSPAFNLSQHQGILNESALRIRRRFSFNISPTNEHPGLISFRMDWLDLLAVQGTLKNLLQHHSLKAPIL